MSLDKSDAWYTDLGTPAPLGAVMLGCRNCVPHEPGKYCYDCPVSRRQRTPSCRCIGHGTCRCEEPDDQ